MRSTGESMGIDADPYLAYYKAQLGAGVKLPLQGTVLLIGDDLQPVAALFEEQGYEVLTRGAQEQDAATPGANGQAGPDESDAREATFDLLVDTTVGPLARLTVDAGIPLVTTREAALWTARALAAARSHGLTVRALQDAEVPDQVAQATSSTRK